MVVYWILFNILFQD